MRSCAILLALVAAVWSPAFAASKRKVAGIGDGAPGGGVYTGPGFRSAPHAAGNGWVVFRSLVADGSTAEVIVLANMLPGSATKIEVAHLGKEVSETVGTIKQFMGRPSVNANGDVAFAATLNVPEPPPPPPGEFPPLPNVENEAAILLYRHATGMLEVVAQSDVDDADLKFDIAFPVDPLLDSSSTDVDERTPALNDLGHVAFLSTTFTGTGDDVSASILLWNGAGDPQPMVSLGQEFDGQPFEQLGPPALNGSDVLAFHGFRKPVDDSFEALLEADGIFTHAGTTTTRLVHGGIVVPPFLDLNLLDGFDDSQPLGEFGNVVAISALGHVAFTSGPFFDPDPTSTSSADSPALFVHRNAVTTAVAYLGLEDTLFLDGTITGIALGDEGGNDLVPPTFDAAGDVIFVAEIDNSHHSVVLAKAADLTDLREVIELGGSGADATPLGGSFSTPTSGVAADGPGGVAIVARLADAPVSEALVYESATGEKSTIRIGEGVPSPSTGFFGGPPFSSPLLNDAGDLVFMAHLVGGPSARGIFRMRDGAITPLVRIGDSIPGVGEGGAHFIDFDGSASMNAGGDIAFTAAISGGKRGVFSVRSDGIETIALTDEEIDKDGDIGIVRIAANPAILDSGAVSFRATLDAPANDPDAPFASDRQENLLVKENGVFEILAKQGAYWPLDQNYFIDRIRDPATAGGPTVAFRVPLSPNPDTQPKDPIPPRLPLTGLFLHDPLGLALVALQSDFVDGADLTALIGRPALDAAGRVAFQATIDRGGGPISALLLSENFDTRIIADGGTAGPSGGTFRSLGAPTMSRSGTLAFRGSFNLGSGGTPGFFTYSNDTIASLLQVGESVAEIEAPAPNERTRFSRFSSFSPSSAINSSDVLAFIGSVSSGSRRNGLFLASPATAIVERATVRIRTKQPPLSSPRIPTPRDRVTIRATLAVGGVSDGVDPSNEPMTIWLSDAQSLTDTGGAVYTASINRGALQASGKSRILTLVNPNEDTRKTVRSMKVAVGKNGIVKLALRSAPLDFVTRPAVFRIPQPPFRVRVQIGDDEAADAIECSGEKNIVCPAK